MTELKRLGDRLNYAMKEKGVSQRHLSMLSGVSQSNISKICTNKSDKTKYVAELSLALGVEPSWLSMGVGEIWTHQEDGEWEAETLARLAGVDLNSDLNETFIQRSEEIRSLTSGNDSSNPSSAIESISIRGISSHKFAGVESPKKLKTCIFYDDSMRPTINSGSLVVMDTSVTSFNVDGLFAFEINNQFYIRRIQRKASGDIAIIPDNEKYDNDVIPGEMIPSVKVHGLVKSVVSVERV